MRKRQSVWLRKGFLLLTTLLLLALSLPVAVFAAPPEGKGGGKPGGWPDGEGPPEGKGPKDGGGETRKGDLFADPIVVVRDLGPSPGLDDNGNLLPGGNGQPVYFTWYWDNSDVDEHGDLIIEDGDEPTGWEITDTGCVQPISLEPLYEGQSPYWDTVYPYLDSYGFPEYNVYLVPLDGECKIPAVYELTWGEQVIETSLGRLNMARTTQDVINAAYAEAIATINTATAIDLDAAGRLVLTIPDVDEGTRLKTIDSPRENLALYQKLMKESCLSGLAEAAQPLFTGALEHLIVCDANNEPSENDLLRAASLLAASGDKFGHVGIDEVVYVNTMLDINTVEPQTNGWLITGYKDVGDFMYTRWTVHGATEARLLQPMGGSDTQFEIIYPVRTYDRVFEGDWAYMKEIDGITPSYPLMNFVRATDDALALIYYIHNYEPPVPVDPVR